MNAMQQEHASQALNLRIGGSLAAVLIRIAQREQNSISSVARRLISESLQRESVRELETAR